MDPPVSNGHVFAPKEVSIPLLVETTTKLFPGLTIQSRPCRPKAGFGLVKQILLKRRSTNLICNKLVLHITVLKETEKWFASVFQGYEKMFVEPKITNPEMSL